jgi:NADP-dependent 3-hydroxy acid dehydrogenase YdfG
MESAQRNAVVTGASSGIGAACARRLAAAGFHVVCAARREDRIAAIAEEVGGTAVVCDIRDEEQVRHLAESVGDHLSVLVNNAGGAFGFESLAEADPATWRAMYELNVIGTLNVTKALLPALLASGDAVVVNMGSTAGHAAYEYGGGYAVAKYGVAAMTQTLRLELLGQPVRITEIAPGMVKTEEFALNRFDGDTSRRDAVYAGVPGPLTADDIADAVTWVATRPAHVNIDHMTIKPRAQASQDKVYRV